jgi:hypothetical protein
MAKMSELLVEKLSSISMPGIDLTVQDRGTIIAIGVELH